MRGRDAATARWVMLGLVAATTVVATARLWTVFRVDGLSVFECLLLALFAVLFSWIAASFWAACLGAHTLWRGGGICMPPRPPAGDRTRADGTRAVLALPIHNEDFAEVAARIAAMLDSIRNVGALTSFDLFILSDSSDPQAAAAEEAGWRRLRRRYPEAAIYYRRRTDRPGRKAGNIAEFCENWGALYRYMVVLDADSLMTGESLVRLVGMMEANPRTALIQVPPLLVGGRSLFARSQQFASWLYGPVFAAGLARLQGGDGNYWGHNAIIRLRPFMAHCGLPVLPGRAPFGGEIMSHDFVEAALLRRAGWEVWMAPQLGGSYEASPPTLIEHLKRDQRWCQGNLQHVRLLFAQGFRLQSRIHLAFGAMSYLSSPVWLLLILFFSADAARLEQAASVTYHGHYPVLSWPIPHTVAFVTLALGTVALLYGPKVLALLLVLRGGTAASFGGRWRLVLGVVLESVLSTLLAPVFMLSHSWFVLKALFGRSVGWGVQRRDRNGVGLANAVAAFGPHTGVALVAGLLAWYWTPGSFWWYLPLFSGLAVAIVLCLMTGDPWWSARARRAGLFTVPSEATPPPILARFEDVLAQAAADDAADAVGRDERLLQRA